LNRTELRFECWRWRLAAGRSREYLGKVTF
jgi:hypothetical protein